MARIPQVGDHVEFHYYCHIRDITLMYPVAWQKCEYPECGSLCCFTAPLCPHHAEVVLGVSIYHSMIGPSAGLGLYARRSFQEGDWICPIWGEPLTCADVDFRYMQESYNAPFLIGLDKHWYVDGGTMPFIGHFANTVIGFDGHCDVQKVNARMEFRFPLRKWEKLSDQEKQTAGMEKRWCLWLRALGPIMAGQEILLDYGPHFSLTGNYEFIITTPTPTPAPTPALPRVITPGGTTPFMTPFLTSTPPLTPAQSQFNYPT